MQNGHGVTTFGKAVRVFVVDLETTDGQFWIERQKEVNSHSAGETTNHAGAQRRRPFAPHVQAPAAPAFGFADEVSTNSPGVPHGNRRTPVLLPPPGRAQTRRQPGLRTLDPLDRASRIRQLPRDTDPQSRRPVNRVRRLSARDATPLLHLPRHNVQSHFLTTPHRSVYPVRASQSSTGAVDQSLR